MIDNRYVLYKGMIADKPEPLNDELSQVVKDFINLSDQQLKEPEEHFKPLKNFFNQEQEIKNNLKILRKKEKDKMLETIYNEIKYALGIEDYCKSCKKKNMK